MAEEYMTDDEQLEAVKRWTAENGPWVVGGVVIGAALLFGYRYYESHQTERALRAAAQFGVLAAALDGADHAAARRLAEGIIKDYSSTPYADQAELALARIDVDDRQLASAIAPLRKVMTDSKDSELRKVARLRLARVLIGQGKPDDAIQTLAEVPDAAAANGAAAGAAPAAAAPFASSYHEVRGDALYAKKDLPGALREYQTALALGGPQSGNAALLQLKISDLGAAPAPVTPKAKL
jgi:predicted negative regulator of RcsB-dependent stress response